MSKYDCDDILNNDDIKKIYNVKEIKKAKLTTDCDSDDKKGMDIDIFNDIEQINSAFILRNYYRNKSYLKKEGSGKVAEHVQCYFHDKYKSFGLGSKLSKREKKVYLENNFSQIHLNNASADGIIVWRKLGFEYVDENTERIILSLWHAYLTDELNLNKTNLKEYINLINNILTIKAIDKKYLYEGLPANKRTFTKWYSDKVNNDDNLDKEISTQMYYNLSEDDK